MTVVELVVQSCSPCSLSPADTMSTQSQGRHRRSRHHCDTGSCCRIVEAAAARAMAMGQEAAAMGQEVAVETAMEASA